jgi:Condensation domain
VLRTTFSSLSGRPSQVIHAPCVLGIPLVEVTAIGVEEREREVRRIAQEEADEPFDLCMGPLVRLKVVRESEEEHVLMVTMHHIISDGWSMGILVKEVAVLYEAYRSGEESALPELAIQYADFAAWQRQRLQGEVLEEQLDYWRRKLSGDLPALEMPTDRRRPTTQTYNGTSVRFVLGPQTSEALRELCRREGVTMFMTLLAAWQTLLHRYTGQDDIRVGTPIASRERAETEGLIGCLLNTLVMRTDFSGSSNFKELLAQVKETALDAYAHQEVPFELLVEELQPERKANYTPLFQVWFVLDNAGMIKPLRLTDLELRPLEIRNDTAQFDLALSMIDAGERIGGKLIYNTDLFDEDSMAEMILRFESLLENVSADSEWRLLDIPLDGRAAETATALEPRRIVDQSEDQFTL